MGALHYPATSHLDRRRHPRVAISPTMPRSASRVGTAQIATQADPAHVVVLPYRHLGQVGLQHVGHAAEAVGTLDQVLQVGALLAEAAPHPLTGGCRCLAGQAVQHLAERRHGSAQLQQLPGDVVGPLGRPWPTTSADRLLDLLDDLVDLAEDWAVAVDSMVDHAGHNAGTIATAGPGEGSPDEVAGLPEHPSDMTKRLCHGAGSSSGSCSTLMRGIACGAPGSLAQRRRQEQGGRP
jgi:hypothetical protein